MVSISTTVMSDIGVPIKVRYYQVSWDGLFHGYIEIPCVNKRGPWSYDFEVKVYGTRSKYGINNGHIRELCVVDSDDCASVINYRRRWYLEPYYPQEYAALNALLTIFDTLQEWEVLD